MIIIIYNNTKMLEHANQKEIYYVPILQTLLLTIGQSLKRWFYYYM